MENRNGRQSPPKMQRAPREAATTRDDRAHVDVTVSLRPPLDAERDATVRTRVGGVLQIVVFDIFQRILSFIPSVRARRVYSYIDLFRYIYKCNTYPFPWNVGLDYRRFGASRAGLHRPRQTVTVHRREVSTSRASFVVSTCARERRARRPWRRRCARRWRCRIRNV